MLKKRLSLLLSAVFTLSSVLPTFAEAKQKDKDKVPVTTNYVCSRYY